jgi:hypothetical protein
MGRLIIAIFLLVSIGSAWAKVPPNVAKAAKAAKAAASGKQQKVPEPPQPQPTPAQPVVPLRPSQMPSVPPRVSYQGGRLTVLAENSTLADIFAAIRSATGMKIETAGGPSGDRVAAKIGPAAPREVMLSLLQGSRYDYVMLGSLTDPEQLERVILTPKNTASASNNNPQPPLRAPQPQPQPGEEEEFENGDQEDTSFAPVRGPERTPPDQQQEQQQPAQGQAQPAPPGAQQQPEGQPYPAVQQPEGQPAPGMQQPDSTQQQQNPNQNPNGQVKTPEELLQDLRRMQEQRQQQQQNPK